jgi:hypothetical protein
MIRGTKLVVTLMLLTLASPMFALRSTQTRHRRAKKVSWFNYRVFIPSHENLLSQNAAIDELGLPRIKNDSALKEMVTSDELVPITQNQYVRVSPKLEAKRRFCRPWVDMFLQELGQEYFAQFGDQIQVNSAVRTERTQFILRRWNRNAAPVHGETASAHLAGVAVDLQRRGLTREQVRFIQQKLLYLAKLNMVIVEEELKQPCFHIVVTGEYPYPPPMPVVIPSDQGVLNGIINPTASQN